MIGGVTRLGGLPGLLGRVTLPAGVAFCHVNVSRWGNPPTRGRFMLPKRAKSEPTTKRPPYLNRNNMFQSRGYQRGDLFRRVHLFSVEGRNQDGNQEESEGIQISSDALSEGPIEGHRVKYGLDHWTLGPLDYFFGLFHGLNFGLFF